MSAKRVRVRVAVAIDGEGHYNVAGDDDILGSEIAKTARRRLYDERLSDDIEVRWVEADIPLPEPPESITVEGEVSDG